MSDFVRNTLLILFILLCFALTRTIDRRADEDEAAGALQRFTIESRADELPGLESLRMVELPLRPDATK